MPLRTLLVSGQSRLVILYAIVLHAVWAVALWIDSAAAYTTAIATLLKFVSPSFAAFTFAAVAALAFGAMFVSSRTLDVYLMLPQQFMLLLSAGGAIEAMWYSRFADGVIRPQAFLIADQLPAVLIAIVHTIAIIQIAKAPIYWRKDGCAPCLDELRAGIAALPPKAG